MAANKFATMLQKNCHNITVILVYAVLEWTLILLLLLNSLFSYLIAKFAQFFGLKPSCTWCSRLEHRAGNNSYLDHVCEAHCAEIGSMSYCSSHSKLAESNNLCTRCSSSPPPPPASPTVAFFTLMSGHSVTEERCSCCDDQIVDGEVYPPQLLKNSLDVILEYFRKNKVVFEADLVGGRKKAEICVEECVSHDSNLEVQEWSSIQTTDDLFENLGCNEDDESVCLADMLLQNAELMDSDRFICIELIDSDAAAKDDEQADNLSDNCVEDEGGRSEEDSISSKGGASEIEGGVESLKAKIEEQEKALNALYEELEEERRAAAEAAKETMAMITKLHEEKAAMQMEAAQYQRMMEEQAEYDQEALQLLNDLMLKREKEKKELEKELEIYRGRYSTDDDDASEEEEDTNSIDLDLDNSIMPDISLAEFDEERVSILDEVKVLEGKLLGLHDEDAMAKKLLPLFDAEEEVAISSQSEGRMLIEEELGHVYERLQALEADKDFLKHCIRSMMKGNQPQGMGLLQEILQHLRDLKSVDILARNMDEIPLPDASS